jgi:G3E family GTPase
LTNPPGAWATAAGKTTLLTRILHNTAGLRVAVIVNDMSDVNVDAAQVQGDVAVRHTDARLVEMSNGCICCTLREDLLVALERLARERRFDYVLVESSGAALSLAPCMQTCHVHCVCLCICSALRVYVCVCVRVCHCACARRCLCG